MINPVLPFYEYYLSVTTYAIPAPFLRFLGLTFIIFVALSVYQLFWHIR